MNSGENIAVWPDDSWCFMDEIEEYSWKSDDYRILVYGSPEYCAFQEEEGMYED